MPASRAVRFSSSSRISSPCSSGDSCHAARRLRLSASNSRMTLSTFHALPNTAGSRSFCRAIFSAVSGGGGLSAATALPPSCHGRKWMLPSARHCITSTSTEGSPSRTAARAAGSERAPSFCIQSSSVFNCASRCVSGCGTRYASARAFFFSCVCSYTQRISSPCAPPGASRSQP